MNLNPPSSPIKELGIRFVFKGLEFRQILELATKHPKHFSIELETDSCCFPIPFQVQPPDSCINFEIANTNTAYIPSFDALLNINSYTEPTKKLF